MYFCHDQTWIVIDNLSNHELETTFIYVNLMNMCDLGANVLFSASDGGFFWFWGKFQTSLQDWDFSGFSAVQSLSGCDKCQHQNSAEYC